MLRHSGALGARTLAELADAIFPVWARTRLMAMLEGYFDESGTADDARVLVVAGYIAEVKQWKRFQIEWWQALANAGLNPNEAPFRMSEFAARRQPHMNGKTPFADWSEKKAIAVFNALIEIICKRVRVGVASVVDVSEYEAIKGSADFPWNRYHFCVTRCIIQAYQWAVKNGIDNPIAYVFEDGTTQEKEVRRAAAELLADKQFGRMYKFDSLTFKSKLEFLQLQAADIVAWQSRRYQLSKETSENPELSSALQTLLSKVPHLSEYFGKQDLERLATHIREKRGQRLYHNR